MLVIVHDRNPDILQGILHLKTFRGGDILEIDAAEDRCDIPHLVDKIRLITFKTDREGIDPGKFLEQDRLSLHHRYRRITPDIAEPEHGGTVRDDRDGVGFQRIFIGQILVLRDLPADFRNARGVGNREIVFCFQGDLGPDAEFSLVLRMHGKRFLVDLVTCR